MAMMTSREVICHRKSRAQAKQLLQQLESFNYSLCASRFALTNTGDADDSVLSLGMIVKMEKIWTKIIDPMFYLAYSHRLQVCHT